MGFSQYESTYCENFYAYEIAAEDNQALTIR